MNEVADALGTRRCVGRAKQVAAQFRQQQPHGAMTMGENDLHQIARGLHQTDIELLGQLGHDRSHELGQARTHLGGQRTIVLHRLFRYGIMEHTKPLGI
jgi:hypothetical protein